VKAFLEGNACVVGLQWGDEGKGKIVDFFTEEADIVVRYCGGANAGHTVRIGGEKYATHLLPVGIFRPGVINVIGNGVVLDPEVLLKEIDEFTGRGIAISPENLRISYKAHLVQEWLPALDGVVEKLERGARVADIGCGHGISTALMATAFARSKFWGFDNHEGSIACANDTATRDGVAANCDHPSKAYPLYLVLDTNPPRVYEAHASKVLPTRRSRWGNDSSRSSLSSGWSSPSSFC